MFGLLPGETILSLITATWLFHFDTQGFRARMRKDPLYGMDLLAEWELIKAKKSKLPRAQRDRIAIAYGKVKR